MVFIVYIGIHLVIIGVDIIAVFIDGYPSHLGVFFLNEFQLFLNFVEVPAGSDGKEGFVGIAVFAHAAHELLERGGSQSAQGVSEGLFGNSICVTDRGNGTIESYKQQFLLGHGSQCDGSCPYAHGPCHYVHLPVLLQDGGIEIERAVVIANHVVHALGAILFKGCFVGCPSCEEQ